MAEALVGVATTAQRGSIVLSHVGKSFRSSDGTTHNVLRDINLEVAPGSFCCILGPSGCGKTTVLNLIAGFEQPSTGELLLDGHTICSAGPDRAVVFQDSGAALFPWLTVNENIAFGPRIRGLSPEAYGVLVRQLVELVGLSAHSTKYPFELSGGMKQRVQIARALANDPEILLMDEPFAALDAITKKLLQVELTSTWKRTKKTIVYITHDISEAVLLGTMIVVMTGGPAATIKARIPIDLPYPRSPLMHQVAELQVRLEELIRAEVYAGQPS